MHIHPGYQKQRARNDIAILKLSKPISQSADVQFIRPATERSVPPARTQVTVYGFGKLSDAGQQAQQLQESKLITWSTRNCNEALNSAGLPDNTKVICASAPNTIACQGDSGGPAVLNGQLVGIASEVEEGCPPGGLNVYTKVSEYTSFIKRYLY